MLSLAACSKPVFPVLSGVQFCNTWCTYALEVANCGLSALLKIKARNGISLQNPYVISSRQVKQKDRIRVCTPVHSHASPRSPPLCWWCCLNLSLLSAVTVQHSPSLYILHLPPEICCQLNRVHTGEGPPGPYPHAYPIRPPDYAN